MSRRLKDYNFHQVYSKWIAETGVFRCFCRATNFVSLKHYPDFEVNEECVSDIEEENPLLNTVANSLHKTLLIIDFPDEKALDKALYLNKKYGLNPIITFNNVLHNYGLVGSKRFINKLVLFSEVIHSKGEECVFVLDSSRYDLNINEADMSKYFNNQYELTEFDLPSSEMLKELGYERALYCYDASYNKSIKEDVTAYLEYLSSEKLEVIINEYREDQ